MVLLFASRRRKAKETGSFSMKSSSTSSFKASVHSPSISRHIEADWLWQWQRTWSHFYDHRTTGKVLIRPVSTLVLTFGISGKRFPLSTVLTIGIQIITRLEQIHRKGFVHRDIKANNFTIGRGDKANIVYIIDFGLAKKYKDLKTGQHIAIRGGKSLVGTARYASIASHDGYEQCRRDDLESLGYLLLYFLRGKLPWQGIQMHDKNEKYA